MAVRSRRLRQAQRVEFGPQPRHFSLASNELRRLRARPLVERAIVFSLRALVERLAIHQAQTEISMRRRAFQFGGLLQQVRR
jgi:hypothetical protein